MMSKFTRPLFAVLMMMLVAAALIVATLSWVESRPGKVDSPSETTATETTETETTETPAVKLAEIGSAARDSTLTRP